MAVIGEQVGLQLDEIVVATNFDSRAELVTRYAQGWARRYCSRITMTHVVDLSLATLSGAGAVGLVAEQMRDIGDHSMQNVIQQLKSAGFRAESAILESYNPAAAIVGLAEELHASLIMMGTHARHGLNKWIQGSCADGVIHHASCPVLLLGPNVKDEKLREPRVRNIIFATDLSHDSAEKAAIALTFAMDNTANIYMCHVLEHAGKDFGQAVEQRLHTELALRRLVPASNYEWCSPEVIVESGRVGEHILDLAERKDGDLIVMGSHRQKNWLLHLKEDIVGHVLAGADCPVMTICTD